MSRAAVRPGLGNSARQGALNRIASKHVDFVVCRVSDLAVVCAVELNDKSHASRRAQSRDELLAKVCQAWELKRFGSCAPSVAAFTCDKLSGRSRSALQVL